MISVSPVHTAAERRLFIKFPWKIYSDYPQWVPPIIRMEERHLDPKTGPFFHDGYHSKAEYFLAYRDGEIVGRIAAIRNGRHDSTQEDGAGFFGFFESINDDEVAAALFEAAEDWLESEGFEIARGPTSFTIFDPAGALIKGHELRPSVQMAYTPPYYADLLENAGYRKVRDLFAYHFTAAQMEENLIRLQRAGIEPELKNLSVRMWDSSQLERDAEIVATVFGSSIRDQWGTLPVKKEDILDIISEMGPFFEEKLAYIVSDHDRPVAVFVVTPDPWEIFHTLNGTIGPIGGLKILRQRRKIKRYRASLMGVLPGYPAAKLSPLFIQKIMDYRKEFPHLESIEMSWILEDNVPARSFVESLGGELTQVYRIYDKYL